MKGWIITDKCKQLKEYKEAEQKEIELINSCFGESNI